MEHRDVPSETYHLDLDSRRDICVKRAKQQFAEERGYDYADVMGKTLQSVPAYGICVYVCHEPSLFETERP
jgi:hypothetical protein